MQLAALLDRLSDTEPDHQGTVPAAGRTSQPMTPCQLGDGELWFADSPADVEAAKALCDTCPAVTACLAGALERREPWGVWGGQLFEGGTVVARKRPRGRPRKDDPRYTEPASAARSAHDAALQLVRAAGFEVSPMSAQRDGQRDDELVA